MGSRSGGRSVRVNNLDEVLWHLEQIEDDYLHETSQKLRRYTAQVANAKVIPALHRGADASSVPQAHKMSRTARAKRDRLVTVVIGSVNPDLSGFKSGVGKKQSARLALRKGGHSKSSQSYRTTLAWGSDRGPHPSSEVNHYGVPRKERGYWVMRTITGGSLLNEVKDAYEAFLTAAISKYGRAR